MLKHLPEGLVPFADCGFARRPCEPLENEPVEVFCRADAEDGEPRLLLRVDGGAETALAARRVDERHFCFSLGGFALGAQVAYRIVTRTEQSPVFAFTPLRERTVLRPKALLREAHAVHAVFDGFCITLTDDAQIVAHTDPVSGQPCERAEWALGQDFWLEIGGSDSIWELKRLSERIVSVESYTVRETAQGQIRQISQRGALTARHVWGTGERFDHADQRGHGSNGRVVEKFTQQGDQTYLPIPFFMTENGLGWYRESDVPVALDFGEGLRISQAARDGALPRDRLFLGAPREVLAAFAAYTGRAALPPDWAFGVWISANGWSCDREVNAQLDALKRYGYPADVMVLEAWSDEQTFYRWNDDGSWQNPAETVRRIRQSGLHLILWQIPVIKHEWNGPGEALRADIAEAVEKGYCVRNADGNPYRITEGWFHNSLLLDFTNPQAKAWWFGKRKYLLDMGVEGFKTDGGEFLFANDARLHDGSRGLEAHNRYPGLYIGAYVDFLRQNGVKGVTFSRAESTGAHTRSLVWAGDQQSLWSELRAQLTAGLSAGLSGVLFWGFDIGGFAGELPTAELYLRATAMGCFCPIMQWHAEPRSGQFYATHEDGFNNDRSPWNLAEKLNAPQVLDVGVRFARLRRQLMPYLTREAAHCVRAGRPMLAHLCVDFARDERAQACDDQYMLGRRLLVAPVVCQGRTEREVYLPHGQWRDFFTQADVPGGRTLRVPCPLDHIPVFERMSEDA